MNFSVITPSFNGMPILRRCVGSVRGQVLPQAEPSVDSCPLPVVKEASSTQQLNNVTTPHAIRVQHIVQDGGSTDGTIEWLERYANEVREQGFRHEALGIRESNPDAQCLAPSAQLSGYSFSYASEPDNGMYDAINKGWERGLGIVDSARSDVGSDGVHSTSNNSQSTILSWLNADEQYLPGTLQKVATYFEAHLDVDVVFGNMIIVDQSGRPLAARREIPFRPFYVKRDFLYTASCTLFFRRTLFDRGLLNFDTSYRLAGDMDLILKLAANGVKFGHINDYLSLFGTDNNNLSVKHKAQMEEEVQHIRRIYGGSNNPWVCKAAKMVRFAERALCGCYRRDKVSFLYANNEQPDYRQITEDALGFRFTYELAQQKADANDK